MKRDLRDKVRYLLDDTDSFSGRFTSFSLLALNIIFVILYVLHTYPLTEVVMSAVWALEVGITAVFLVEYLARIWVSEDGLRKVIEPLMVVDLMAILPVILVLAFPQFGLFNAGFLRLFRIFRIFRFFRLTQNREFFWGKVSESDLQIIKLITIIFSIFFVSAGFFHEVEITQNPNVEVFRDSLYYMVVTLTTVGFGDITPVTNAGRWITIISIMAGIVLIPWQASRIVKAWSHQDKREVKCDQCGLMYHDPDASHCKACGAVIDQEYDSRKGDYL